MKITWSPEAIDGLNLRIQRPNDFIVMMKVEQGYELPLREEEKALLTSDNDEVTL